MEEKLIIINQENNSKKNVPRSIIIHTNDTFRDIYAKAVINLINIMRKPI